MATETVQQLLSPEFLAQLERLTLASRRVFRGRVKGERRSPRKGHSVEFFDYRQYGVGDDLRYVDWNIAGRLDRLHVKLFLDEEDLCLHLLVDASASMGFGDKLRYTARLAGALGFVGLVNLERVGVGIVRDRMTEGWPPTRGRNQFLPLAHYLSGVRAGGATGLNEALGTYASRAREAGVAVVISDLMDPGGFEVGLRALLERRFDVHVVQVLAPEEENPAFAGDLQLVDSETGDTREITLDGEALRAYRNRLHAFFERVETFCRAHEIGYRRVVTSTALEDFMLTELKGLILG